MLQLLWDGRVWKAVQTAKYVNLIQSHSNSFNLPVFYKHSRILWRQKLWGLTAFTMYFTGVTDGTLLQTEAISQALLGQLIKSNQSFLNNFFANRMNAIAWPHCITLMRTYVCIIQMHCSLNSYYIPQIILLTGLRSLSSFCRIQHFHPNILINTHIFSCCSYAWALWHTTLWKVTAMVKIYLLLQVSLHYWTYSRNLI